MNKLLATLIAGTFAVVSSAAFGQAAQLPAETAKPGTGMAKEMAKDPKGSAAAYNNPAAEVRQEQKSQAGAAAVAKSKEQPRVKAKYDEKAAQALVDTGTNPAQQKANVAASKAASPTREKMPDLSKLTKEQKQELYRQLQKENTGG